MQECVRVYFLANDGLRCHEDARTPTPISATEKFITSFMGFNPSDDLFYGLFESLAKKVYGIGDEGLHDEIIEGRENERRLRVGENRVHYQTDGGEIKLLEFGGHRVNGVG